MISQTLIDAMKRFESLSLKSYKCPAGVWTIGYGHTKGVTPEMKISEGVADAWLREDLKQCYREVERLLKGKRLSVHQMDALTDFVFNLGAGRLQHSTLLKKVLAGAPTAEVQAEFRKWVYAGKVKLAGLVKRREWDAQRWAGKV